MVGSHLSDNHDDPTLDWFLVTVQFVWRWSLGTVVVASPIIEYHSFHEAKTHASADLTSGPPWACLELLSAFDKSLPVENEEVAPTHRLLPFQTLLKSSDAFPRHALHRKTYALFALNQSPLHQNGWQSLNLV